MERQASVTAFVMLNEVKHPACEVNVYPAFLRAVSFMTRSFAGAQDDNHGEQTVA